MLLADLTCRINYTVTQSHPAMGRTVMPSDR